MRPSRPFSSLTPKKLLLWSASLLWVGCGGGGSTDVVLPALSVTTSTGGVELDPDGYGLTLDGGSDQPIGVNGTLVVDLLPDGDHTVGLDGVAPNCAASGDNPRTVTVHSGSTATVDFAVTCSATTGSIDIAATTTGSGSDPDGFTILLDGNDRGSIGSGATTTLDQLSGGIHSVGLSGLAANCQVVGDNPRNVTVTPGQTVQVPFTITCSAPPASSGTLQISIATAGPGQDPDGYSVKVDNGTPQPVGSNATLTLINLSAAQHSVRLLGLAANCSVSGQNPAQVAIPSGGTGTVNFAVTCSAGGPNTGGLQVSVATSGSSIDPNGYALSVDGGGAHEVGVNGSLTITELTAGSHTVQLNGVAPNCTVEGDNPRTVTITAGQNSTVGFSITCSTTVPGTGSLKISAVTSGSSQDDGYTVSVDNGNPQTLGANGSRTVTNVAVGSHTVVLGGVASNCTVAGGLSQSVTVSGGQTATVTFTVGCVAVGASVNLRIEGMYLTQSTQTLSRDVPLVQGRDAYIRVFATANVANTPRPPVRVRFFSNGTPTTTLSIPGGAGTVPMTVKQGDGAASWNMLVPASVVQPNTQVLVDIDPSNTISESNETDNSFPVSGAATALTVQAVPAASIVFVPIKQAGNGLQGSVESPDKLLDLTRRMYPLRDVHASVHLPYTTSTHLTLNAFNSNAAWDTTVAELDMLRVAEGTGQTYFGMVHVDYGAGINGIGYVGVPTAVGSDAPAEVQRVVAHELGHTWGRWHTPCGNPGGLDPFHQYPYPGGIIGAFGFDVTAGVVKDSLRPDIMSYCPNEWISDYTYKNVLSFRALNPSASLGSPQPSLIVWGHIVNGRPVLEPSFRLVTRPNLPTRAGPYTLEARAADGSRLFGFSFDAAVAADGSKESRHFAFAIPLASGPALQSLRLSGPAGGSEVQAPAAAAGVGRGGASDEIGIAPAPGGATLKWNAATHPMIMVRDPDTGEVLSLVRGGTAQVQTRKREVVLEVSDGIGSHRLRRAISR